MISFPHCINPSAIPAGEIKQFEKNLYDANLNRMYLAANRSSLTLPGLLPALLCSRATINHGQQTERKKRPSHARHDTGNSGSGNPALCFQHDDVERPRGTGGSKSFSCSAVKQFMMLFAGINLQCRSNSSSTSKSGKLTFLLSKPLHRNGTSFLLEGHESNSGDNSVPIKGEVNSF